MEDSTKLTVNTEEGKVIEINVLDIIASNEYNKEFIIYNIINNENNVFASVLEEDDNSFTLKAIDDAKEYEFVNKEIEKLALDKINGGIN